MSGIKLDTATTETGHQALAYMSCLESLEAVRSKLSYWLGGVEDGEFTVSEIWHNFNWIHDEMCQNLALLKQAENELFEQSQVLLRALD